MQEMEDPWVRKTVGGGSVPVVLPGVANMAGNPPGARQGRDETWRIDFWTLWEKVRVG